MIALGVIGLLLPLAVVGGIVYAIARAVRGDGEVDWGQLVRQFFQHLLAVTLAFVATSGVARLLTTALEGPGLVASGDELAGPVAFAVVGVPLYAAMMWWLLGQARRDEGEARTLVWSLHLGVVGVVALVVTMVAVFELLDALRGVDGNPVHPLGNLVVWGGLWTWYRWLEHRRVGSRRWAVLHVLVGTVIGLGTLVGGAFRLVADAVAALVATDATIVVEADPWGDVQFVVIGGAVWAVYWLLDGVRRERDAWWHGFVLLGGVASTLLTMIGSAAYLLWLGAVWLVGAPGSSATVHFETVPEAAATLATSAAVWAYHHSLLVPRAARQRTEVDRVHDLLLAGVGLAAAAVGFGTILVAIVEALVGPAALQVGTEPVNTLLAAITVLVVGAPVWWRSWSRAQRLAGSPPLGRGDATTDPDAATTAERRSPTRRVYLFALFGIGGVAALTSLLVGAMDVFEDVFTGQFGAETIYTVRIGLAVLVTSAAVAALHWTVYTEDRDAAVEVPRRFPARITLVGVADSEIVDTLGAATDSRVELWTRSDGPMPPWSSKRLTAVLEGRTDEHVLVIARPDEPEVLPLGG